MLIDQPRQSGNLDHAPDGTTYNAQRPPEAGRALRYSEVSRLSEEEAPPAYRMPRRVSGATFVSLLPCLARRFQHFAIFRAACDMNRD